ncbi:hypothetical protein L596_013022 [Steinernema carpocapsae]|uniref:MSP domain-containing protein n=1 Tax=Steinernema carpocapsae TaxID=34508 RepID=A0A4U5NZL4_STECR|nr:hypothetical protein L596_013022 [Steinernema carpocapsae]
MALALVVEPAILQVSFSPAAGCTGPILLHNVGEVRLGFKVKCSLNKFYTFKPIFGIIEPHTDFQVELTRTNGPPGEHKIVIEYLPASPEVTSAKTIFTKSSKCPSCTMQVQAVAA